MQKQNNLFSAENANEGILHVIFYLALFISNKTPDLFAIDNIETALNPNLCRSLIKELATLSKERGKQALITTHNPAVLDGLNLYDDSQRLFEVYRTDEGMTKVRRIQFKKGTEKKQNKLSEMWMEGLLGAIPQDF
jgi:predicted ATPase